MITLTVVAPAHFVVLKCSWGKRLAILLEVLWMVMVSFPTTADDL